MTTQSRTTVFWTSLAVSAVLLQVIEVICLSLLERAGLGHNLVARFGGFAVVTLAVSAYVATLVCRRLGISGERTVREVLTEPTFREMMEPVVMRTPRSVWGSLAVCYAAFVVLFILALGTSKHGHRPELWLMAGGGVFAAVFLYCVFRALVPGPPNARLDVNGVSRSGRRSPIPWNAIHTCEILTVHNALGQVAKRTAIFSDQSGKVLTRISLSEPRQTNTRPFLEWLRAHFGRLEVIRSGPEGATGV